MSDVGDEGGVVVTLVCGDVVTRLGGAELLVDGRLPVELTARAVRVAGEELRGGVVLVEDVEEMAVDGDDDLPPVSEGDWDRQPFQHDTSEEGVEPCFRAMAGRRLAAVGDDLGRFSARELVDCVGLVVRGEGTGRDKVHEGGPGLAAHGGWARGGRGVRPVGLEFGEEVGVGHLGKVTEEGVAATDVFNEELGDGEGKESHNLSLIRS
jgi:hypothetical protein